MKDFRFELKEFISKGLAPNDNPKNSPLLVQSVGAIPYNGVLQAIEQFTRIDTSTLSGVEFPFPQLFVLSNDILVCTINNIYSLNEGTLTLKLANIFPGVTWSVADYKSYLYLTNGQVAVTRDPVSGVFSVNYDMPFGSSICDHNGQALLGSPNKEHIVSVAGSLYLGGAVTGGMLVTILPGP